MTELPDLVSLQEVGVHASLDGHVGVPWQLVWVPNLWLQRGPHEDGVVPGLIPGLLVLFQDAVESRLKPLRSPYLVCVEDSLGSQRLHPLELLLPEQYHLTTLLLVLLVKPGPKVAITVVVFFQLVLGDSVVVLAVLPDGLLQVMHPFGDR